MHWDRGVIVFTDRIIYNLEPYLIEFFERYDTASPGVRGSDKYVGQPLPDEVSAVKKHPAFQKPLLAVSFHCNGLHETPNRYIIGAPRSRPSLPIGRSTHTSIAYDVQMKKFVFMKDSWPIFVHENMMEGQLYERLNKGGVQNIPICLDFCDGDEHRCQTLNIQDDWVPKGLEFVCSIRRHHCLILDTVGKPLDEFGSSFELSHAVRAAVIGMSPKKSASASH